MSTGYIPKELRERVARQAQFEPAEAAVEKLSICGVNTCSRRPDGIVVAMAD